MMLVKISEKLMLEAIADAGGAIVTSSVIIGWLMPGYISSCRFSSCFSCRGFIICRGRDIDTPEAAETVIIGALVLEKGWLVAGANVCVADVAFDVANGVKADVAAQLNMVSLEKVTN